MKSALIASQLLPAFHTPMSAPPVDLELRSDAVLALVGPDMTIKSAWMKCLSAIEPAAQGELIINQRDALKLSRSDWQELRRQCVYMDDDTRLVSVFNVQENILLPAGYHKLNNRAALLQQQDRILQHLGFAQAGNLAELPAYIDELEAVQAMLARALLLQPAILCLANIFNLIGREQGMALLRKTLDWLSREEAAALLAFHHDGMALERANAVLYVSDTESCYYKTREEYEKSRAAAALS